MKAGAEDQHDHQDAPDRSLRAVKKPWMDCMGSQEVRRRGGPGSAPVFGQGGRPGVGREIRVTLGRIARSSRPHRGPAPSGGLPGPVAEGLAAPPGCRGRGAWAFDRIFQIGLSFMVAWRVSGARAGAPAQAAIQRRTACVGLYRVCIADNDPEGAVPMKIVIAPTLQRRACLPPRWRWPSRRVSRRCSGGVPAACRLPTAARAPSTRWWQPRAPGCQMRTGASGASAVEAFFGLTPVTGDGGDPRWPPPAGWRWCRLLRNPLQTTSFGTGELIRAALIRGASPDHRHWQRHQRRGDRHAAGARRDALDRAGQPWARRRWFG